MVTKEILQSFVDLHADEIAEILPGGLKNKAGKWILVCPIMERFDLDFSKVKVKEPVSNKDTVVETVTEQPKKGKKSKKK